MGGEPSKQEIVPLDHLFETMRHSKGDAQLFHTVKKIWEKSDRESVGYLNKEGIIIFVTELFVYFSGNIATKNHLRSSKEEVINYWVKWLDKNGDGKISWDEFKGFLPVIVNEEESAFDAKETHFVLIVHKIELFNIPVSFFSSSQPFCVVEYQNRKKKTTQIKNTENPVWVPDLVFLGDRPFSAFHIRVYDEENASEKAYLQKFTVEPEQFEALHKEENGKITLQGSLVLHEKVAALAKEGCAKPYFKITIEHEKWCTKDFGSDVMQEMKMCSFAKLMWFALQKASLSEPSVSADQVPIPKVSKSLKMQKLLSKINIYIEDPTVPCLKKSVRLFCSYMRSLPIIDDFKSTWVSREDGLETIGRLFGNAIPVAPEGQWTDPTSDAAMTQFFFKGIGATRIQRCAEGFYADFDVFKKYTVRDGYLPYQGKVSFDKLGRISSINLVNQVYKPKDGHAWEFAKFALRSVALTIVTAVDHLIWGHFIWSNFSISIISQHLSADHPLRRLLHIHTYRGTHVNENALEILVPKGGALNRAMAFHYHSLFGALEDSIGAFKYETFPAFLKKNGMNYVDPTLFPMVHDGMQYYNILFSYVKKYISVYYTGDVTRDSELVTFYTNWTAIIPGGLPPLSKENLVEVITQFIFMVTAWHSQVGNVAPYAKDPAFAAAAVVDGRPLSDPQTTIIQALIVIGTSLGSMPVMLQDFSHLMLDDKGKAVVVKFQKELKELSETIEELNSSHPERNNFNTFNPKYIQTSIAV